VAKRSVNLMLLQFLCQQKVTGAVYVTCFLSTDGTQCCQLCFVFMFFVYLANNLLFLLSKQVYHSLHLYKQNTLQTELKANILSCTVHYVIHTQLHICTATSLANCYTLFYQPENFYASHMTYRT